MSDHDPYQIVITHADAPQRVMTASNKPGGYQHTQEMVTVRMSLPADHVRRIDEAAASINVGRPDVIRAIIRQAIDTEGGAQIRARWGSSHQI